MIQEWHEPGSQYLWAWAMFQEHLQVGAEVAMVEHLQISIRYLTALPVANCLANNKRPKLERLNPNKKRDSRSV